MDERLAEAGENHPFQVGQGVQAFDNAAECLHGHARLRIFPDVADAGAAIQVAGGGRFDI